MTRVTSGYARTGTNSVLGLIQKGQDRLFESNSPGLIWKDDSNKGLSPYLLTTTNVYEYQIIAANLSSGAIDTTINGTTYNLRAKRVIRVYTDSTDNIGSEIDVDSYPALESGIARLLFLENPGTSTTQYFIDFEFEPLRLISETIPLMVPELFEDAIFSYVIGRIQMDENGLYNDFMDRFENEWIPKFQDYMSKSKNASAKINRTKSIYQ